MNHNSYGLYQMAIHYQNERQHEAKIQHELSGETPRKSLDLTGLARSIAGALVAVITVGVSH